MITCLADQLRRDEDDRQWAYDDATRQTLAPGDTLHGKLTIGVGHNLSASGLPQKIRDLLLLDDIQIATNALEGNFPWTCDLDPVRQEVPINMTFNMGVRELAKFQEFLGYLRTGNWQNAAAAMLDSLWAKQVGDRAQRLAIQIQSGFRQ